MAATRAASDASTRGGPGRGRHQGPHHVLLLLNRGGRGGIARSPQPRTRVAPVGRSAGAWCRCASDRARCAGSSGGDRAPARGWPAPAARTTSASSARPSFNCASARDMKLIARSISARPLFCSRPSASSSDWAASSTSSSTSPPPRNTTSARTIRCSMPIMRDCFEPASPGLRPAGSCRGQQLLGLVNHHLLADRVLLFFGRQRETGAGDLRGPADLDQERIGLHR